MKISVIGTGYVGLVSGVVFADLGHDVICMDKNAQKIENLKKGIMPIYEPGLDKMTMKNYASGKLSFTHDIREAVVKSEIIIIAVDTMPKDNWETDLRSVKAVARDIGKYMNNYKVIVTKSTVPVGTGNLVEKIIRKNMKKKHNFDIVFNPEFLREGQAIFDTLHPDRVIIGSDNVEAAMKIVELYQDMNTVIKITKLRSAELIKYASNAFLAAKISFINAMAVISEYADGDIMEIAEGMGLDKRIGREFLNPGIGYGGSCFPKDVGSMIHTSAALGYRFKLLEEVRNVNEMMIKHLFAKMSKAVKLKGRNVAVIGLAFKPETDDIREARSVILIKMLLKAGSNVTVCDPEALENVRFVMGNKVRYADDVYECTKGADISILVTEWEQYRNANLSLIKKGMQGKWFFDGRNIFDPETMKDIGFKYISIGR